MCVCACAACSDLYLYVCVRGRMRKSWSWMVGWRTRGLRLGNRGGVGIVTAAGVHTEDRSLGLEPGVMASSGSVLPESALSLLKEKRNFLNWLQGRPGTSLLQHNCLFFLMHSPLSVFSLAYFIHLLKYDSLTACVHSATDCKLG